MAVKNSKTRPVDNPYEVWTTGDWTWKILKFYSNDLDDPFARVFCDVETPFAHEMGDVYYSEITRYARKVETNY